MKSDWKQKAGYRTVWEPSWALDYLLYRQDKIYYRGIFRTLNFINALFPGHIIQREYSSLKILKVTGEIISILHFFF